MIKKFQSTPIRSIHRKVERIFSLHPHFLMSIMFLIWVILLGVFCQPMFMPDSKDCKEIMSYMYVVLINMEQPQKLRHFNKKRHLNKFVTITMPFIEKFMSGSISGLIILVELVLNGMLKFVNKFSLISKKMVEF